MKITYDPAKDCNNRKKHGVSLAEAEHLDWSTALERLDARNDYGEDRYTALGFIGDRLYYMVFAERAEERRIISLRKASKREYKEYGKFRQA